MKYLGAIPGFPLKLSSTLPHFPGCLPFWGVVRVLCRGYLQMFYSAYAQPNTLGNSIVGRLRKYPG